MNCGNEALDAVLKIEKLAIAAPELARHIIFMANTVHQAYHTAEGEFDKPWRECPRPFCSSSFDIVNLTCPGLLS